MFLACIMFVINKYLSNESILALPISLVPLNQSYRKLLSQMYSKLVCRAGYTFFRSGESRKIAIKDRSNARPRLTSAGLPSLVSYLTTVSLF